MTFNNHSVPLFLFRSARKRQKNVSTKSKTWLFVTTCPSKHPIYHSLKTHIVPLFVPTDRSAASRLPRSSVHSESAHFALQNGSFLMYGRVSKSAAESCKHDSASAFKPWGRSCFPPFPHQRGRESGPPAAGSPWFRRAAVFRKTSAQSSGLCRRRPRR